MNISNYLKSGYACLFIETSEIKRAVKSIVVDEPFIKVNWDFVSGVNGSEVNQIEILEKAKELTQTAVILENYDFFLDNNLIVQTFLNNYEDLKFKSVCLVIVGNNIAKIPPTLKELVPVIQFDLPDKATIKTIAENTSKSAQQAYESLPKEDKEKFKWDFNVSDDVVEACLGMSYEEIENVLSLSMIEYKCFNTKTILERKRQVIKATGFMDFISPEPMENLGGLDNLKQYLYKRKEAWEPGSNKPKFKSILLAGIAGSGKSLSVKCMASIFHWPAIILDIGSLKGGIVGETEKNVRLACKTIDAIGKCILMVEEIEKSLGGSSQNLDSGVSSGMLGYLLTWMQERKSEGIIAATANDLTKLPPEMLRAGRWDSLFFVDFPNENEIKSIIEIMNRKYKSNLPTTIDFCKELKEEGWVGAEIEQLAKDSHFDSLEKAKENIPLLSDFRKKDVEEIREKSKQFRIANGSGETVITRKKVSLKTRLEESKNKKRNLNLN